jgi:hypothetical protein
MTMRTTNKTITFHQPFRLEGVDGVLPPADYRVVTDEEIIEGCPSWPTIGSRPASSCRRRLDRRSRW